MNEAYIVDGVRTAIGNIGGQLSEVRADLYLLSGRRRRAATKQ